METQISKFGNSRSSQIPPGDSVPGKLSPPTLENRSSERENRNSGILNAGEFLNYPPAKKLLTELARLPQRILPSSEFRVSDFGLRISWLTSGPASGPGPG